MASAHMFEHAFDALPGACLLLDEAGQIIAVNARFRSEFASQCGPGMPLAQLYCDPLDGLTARWKRPRTAEADEIVDTALGVKAIGTNPRRPLKNGIGTVGEAVKFGGVTFRPGECVYADGDAVVVTARPFSG